MGTDAMTATGLNHGGSLDSKCVLQQCGTRRKWWDRCCEHANSTGTQLGGTCMKTEVVDRASGSRRALMCRCSNIQPTCVRDHADVGPLSFLLTVGVWIYMLAVAIRRAWRFNEHEWAPTWGLHRACAVRPGHLSFVQRTIGAELHLSSSARHRPAVCLRGTASSPMTKLSAWNSMVFGKQCLHL